MQPLDHQPIRAATLQAIQDAADAADRRVAIVGLVAALALHASLGIGFLNWEPEEQIAPPGDMMITIDLSPAALATASQNAGESAESAPEVATPPEKVEEETTEETPPEPTPPEPEKVDEPPPEPLPPEPTPPEPTPPEPLPPEPTPNPATVETPPVEAPKVESAPVIVAPPKAAPPKKAVQKPKKKTPPPQAATQAGATSTQRSDIAGSGASASPTEIARYTGRVRAAIERNKRSPAGSPSGSVNLSFTVTASGAVTGLRVSGSSGSAVLDNAARQAVAGANIPPIPESLPRSFSIGVAIRFQ
ncbi:energy transducer TonB family protein [Flaviflagellibacter deserti]|uniref:Energy transducer TonB n=1 Tax=Flaviflagellibacter deserti TaxID=2267266 RepID=A0ABV9YYN6_9HYPH